MSENVSPEIDYARLQAKAVLDMTLAGITLGEPERPNMVGCRNCVWHLHKNGEQIDGGDARAIAANIADGRYGDDASVLTLHPVMSTVDVYEAEVGDTLRALRKGETTPVEILTGLSAEEIADLGGEG